MINFNTDKLIFLAYPPGSGGKFVTNCLAFSRGAVIQDHGMIDLSYYDLYNHIEYLFERDKDLDYWNDLNLGCIHLFGFDWQFQNLSKEVYAPRIEELSNGDRYFFKIAHTKENLDHNMKFFPNAKVLALRNCMTMISKRNVFNRFPEQDVDCDYDYVWDVEWFFDEQQTINGLAKLYEDLGLTDFQKVIQYIKPYRTKWLETILSI